MRFPSGLVVGLWLAGCASPDGVATPDATPDVPTTSDVAAVDHPADDVSSIDAPDGTDAPGIDVPDVPGTDAPGIDVPDVPGIDAPGIDAPDVPDVLRSPDAPDAGAPDAGAPDAGAPDAGAPIVDAGECVALAVGATYTLDITAHPVTVRTTVGGASASSSGASLVLRDTARGDFARIAAISSGRSSPILVVPGTYDLYYQAGLSPPGTVVPTNLNALLRRGVRVDRPIDLEVDIPRGRVTGRVTTNGSPATGGCVTLINPATGDRADLDVRAGGVLDSLVVPGTYELHVGGCGGALAGPSPLLRAGVVVREGDNTVDVDLHTGLLRGNLTAPPPAAAPGGYVELHDLASGAIISLGYVYLSSSTVPYAERVPFGTYDLVYSRRTSGTVGTTVGNSLARLMTGVRVDGDRTFNVRVPSVDVTFRATLLGRELVPGQGGVYFRNGDDNATSSTRNDGTRHALLVPGTYDMMWAGSAVPRTGTLRNERYLLRAGVAMTGPTTDPIDVTPVALTGAVTRNGAADTVGFGNVQLERPADEDRAVLANITGSTPYSVLVMPGTYDVVYARTSSSDLDPGSSIVRNMHAVLRRGVTIAGPTTLDINVPATALRGRVTLNGLPARDNQASLVFRRRGDPADTARMTSLPESNYLSVIVPGTYEVFVVQSNPQRAQQIANTLGPVGCVVVP